MVSRWQSFRVLGTHTHVATADERVLPGGTAYITDVGMTGPHDSVIGMDKAGIVQRFLDGMPARFTVSERDVRMNAVLIDVDESTGHARSIERLVFRRRLVGAGVHVPPMWLWVFGPSRATPASGAASLPSRAATI